MSAVKITLATQSQTKVDALQTYWESNQQSKLTLQTLSTKTSYCQPLGDFQAKLCIDERLEQACSVADADSQLVLAFENFIFFNEADGKFYDCCLIAKRTRCADATFSEIVYSKTDLAQCVLVPSMLYEQLKPYLNNKTHAMKETGGKLLEQHFANDQRYKHDDWFLCAGSAFTRTQQIVMVLGGVLGE